MHRHITAFLFASMKKECIACVFNLFSRCICSPQPERGNPCTQGSTCSTEQTLLSKCRHLQRSHCYVLCLAMSFQHNSLLSFHYHGIVTQLIKRSKRTCVFQRRKPIYFFVPQSHVLHTDLEYFSCIKIVVFRNHKVSEKVVKDSSMKGVIEMNKCSTIQSTMIGKILMGESIMVG